MIQIHRTKTVNHGIEDKSVSSVTFYYRPQDMFTPRYPLPAIPLSVHWPDTGYLGMVYIDADNHEDDPIMVYAWDGWNNEQVNCSL